MWLRALGFVLLLAGASAKADPPVSQVDQCLSCHLTSSGEIDIVGLVALRHLPEEWPFLFEDAFDLDGDGISGRMRFVSGPSVPLVARFGQSLAAARFQDFAMIAGAAHGVDLTEPGILTEIEAAFAARSPDPDAFSSSELQSFEARGCARCHVTRTFEANAMAYQPLSDFLLHETPAGLRRTKPLWGCKTCLTAAGHTWLD